MASPQVAVVGAGISGLAAAYALARDGPPGLRVTVLDAAGSIGGKLRTGELAGRAVDEGAESFLARRPEAADLARAVGLGEALVAPATTAAAVWYGGRLRPLPARTLLGVPTDLRALARSRVLDRRALARAAAEPVRALARTDGDVAVGPWVAARFGRQVVERLVDPLLGGVYAGRADALSLDATLPALRRPARAGTSLLRHGRALLGEPTEGPVFLGLTGGLGRLAPAVAAASGADLRLRTTVRELHRRPDGGLELVCGPVPRAERLAADAVVLAVPAAPAARLLRDVAPYAAGALDEVDYASVAVVCLALDWTGPPPAGSGFLVPAVAGRLVKAVTYLSAKWPPAGGRGPDGRPLIVRCSVGRHGEADDLQRDDAELVAGAVGELRAALGRPVRPVAARVVRWGGGLPQYAVGHLDRVARVRAGLEPLATLAVAGAWLDGVGIPACVRSGQEAAGRVLAALSRRGWR